MRKLLPIFTVMVLILSACNFQGEAEPTMSLEDMQATAQAQAQTAIAQTQMAMPTPTQEPTNTPEPEPSPEPEPEPVVEQPQVIIQPEVQPVIIVQPTEEQSSGGNNCSRLTKDTKGRKVFVRVANTTAHDITFSATLYLTELGSCGSTSVTLEKKGSSVLEIPEGCYFLYTWINHPKKPTTNSREVCLKADKNNGDKILQKWQVTYEGIVVIEQ